MPPFPLAASCGSCSSSMRRSRRRATCPRSRAGSDPQRPRRASPVSTRGCGGWCWSCRAPLRWISTVEGRQLAFGGGGGYDGKFEEIAARPGRGCASDEDRVTLAAFLESEAAVIRHEVRELRDAWFVADAAGQMRAGRCRLRQPALSSRDPPAAPSPAHGRALRCRSGRPNPSWRRSRKARVLGTRAPPGGKTA